MRWRWLFHWLDSLSPLSKRRDRRRRSLPWLLTILFFLSFPLQGKPVCTRNHKRMLNELGGQHTLFLIWLASDTIRLNSAFCNFISFLLLFSTYTSMMSSPHQQPEQQHQQQPNTSTPFIDPSSVMVAAAYSAAGLPPLSHLLLPDQQQPLEPPTPQHTPAPMSSCAFYYPSPPQEPENNKAYSFVPGATQKKRPRRKYHEIERLYPCSYPGCTKSYGTLNHLNAHVAMQKHVSFKKSSHTQYVKHVMYHRVLNDCQPNLKRCANSGVSRNVNKRQLNNINSNNNSSNYNK